MRGTPGDRPPLEGGLAVGDDSCDWLPPSLDVSGRVPTVFSSTNLTRACPVLSLVGALALVSCARPQAAPSRVLPGQSAVEQLHGGATLALPRPTPEVAWLSLWLAVGARDGDVPQLATAAAWLVAERASAQARVEPEATEISVQCDVAGAGLTGCVERLGRALTRHEVSAAEALHLRERLQATRLRAASDPGRLADERALRALLASDADGFFPLGKVDDDSRLTAGALSAFLAQHMRVERAILIAAGDVQDRALDLAFARFRPRGQALAIQRPAAPRLRSELSVEEDERGSLSFALAVPDAVLAASVAQRFDALYAGSRTRVARLSSFTLLHVRLPAGPEPFVRLQRAVFDLRRLAAEQPARGPAPRDDTLRGLARELGELWVARGTKAVALPARWPMGTAITLRAGSIQANEKDANLRRSRLEDMARAAVAAGEANALGPLMGTSAPMLADLTVPNGVQIKVERRPGDRWLSAVLRVAHGSREDPDTKHGRAALLATWLSDGCGFAHARALDAHLSTIDARISPLVSADATGVSVVAPQQHWQAALDTLLRCALRPSADARSIEDARTRLLAALTLRTSALYEAFAARALASVTPGFVASWGTPLGVSAVSAAELRRLHREAMQGANLTVSLAVDVDPGEVARFVSRRVAQLERGQTNALLAPAAASPNLLGEQLAVTALRVLVAVRADGDARNHVAPEVLATALSDALSARIGEAVWHAGAGNATLAFSAVTLATTEANLRSIEAVVATTLHELGLRSDESWRAALRAARLDRNALRSGTAGFIATALEAVSASPPANEELEAVKRLLRATPHFVVLRPRP